MDRINREIEGLGRARTHAELVAALQQILGRMAYYISQSEGIVLDEQERWHGDYTEALYADAGVARAVARTGPPPAAREAPAPPGGGASGTTRHQSALVYHQHVRARGGDIPSSLRPIYDGTHASFSPDA